MKERPILFSGSMVRAILDGRKTQTRHVVKPQPEAFCSHVEPFRGERGGWIAGDNTGRVFQCPYGQPGDRLWVRETFCELRQTHYDDPGKPKDLLLTRYTHPRRNGAAYRAECDAGAERIREEYGYRWKPSIHMPRWASRITLEITGVRVERLQDISTWDALQEGIRRHEPAGERALYHEGAFVCVGDTPATAYRALWESINDPGSWDANPWVWVVEFRRLEGTPDAD